MKIYEKRMETREREYYVGQECDICHRTSKHHRFWGINKGMNVEEVEIQCEIASQSSDGGWGKRITCCICPVCFETIVMPLLKEKGVQFVEEEIDW
jgi:hypothetical protein